MASYSYTTAENVQAELRSSTAFGSSTVPSLTQVTNWIQEESAQVNRDAGKVYGSTTYSQDIDYDGSERIQLKNAPIITVNSLVYSTSALGTSTYALSDTKVEDTDYAVYDENGEVMILFGNWSPATGNKRMQINYDAGYNTVPDEITKLATKYVAKRVIDTQLEGDINAKGSGKSISVGSISIVKNSDFGVCQYKELKQDIKDLKQSLVTGFGVHRYTNY